MLSDACFVTDRAEECITLFYKYFVDDNEASNKDQSVPSCYSRFDKSFMPD
jgi:hypothetical protein